MERHGQNPEYYEIPPEDAVPETLASDRPVLDAAHIEEMRFFLRSLAISWRLQTGEELTFDEEDDELPDLFTQLGLLIENTRGILAAKRPSNLAINETIDFFPCLAQGMGRREIHAAKPEITARKFNVLEERAIKLIMLARTAEQKPDEYYPKPTRKTGIWDFSEPLLNSQEVVELSKIIEVGVFAAHCLEVREAGTSDEPEIDAIIASHAITTEELEIMKKQGEEAFDRMLRANLRLARYWLSIMRNGLRAAGINHHMDVMPEAVGYLEHGLRKYDYTRAKVSTYVSPWIKRAIYEAMASNQPITIDRNTYWRMLRVSKAEGELRQRRMNYDSQTLAKVTGFKVAEVTKLQILHNRLRGAVALNSSLGPHQESFQLERVNTIADPTALSPEDVFLLAERNQAIHQAAQTLPELQRQIILRRYGWYGDVPSDSALAKSLGLTTKELSSLHNEALATLRTQLKP